MEGPPPGPRRSRRWFLGASATTAGFVVLRCGGGSGSNTPTNAPLNGSATADGQTAEPASAPADGTPGTALDPALRVTGFVFGDGQFDPHLTRVGTLHGQQAFVYSRLLKFRDQARGDITTDLATSMPEQPDPTTYIFTINPAARWHDVPPVDGRQLTAEDVVHSFRRQIDGGQSFPRNARWNAIASIEATAPDTVTLTTNIPLAPMVSWLADSNAYIVAPEQDTEGFGFTERRQIGSGPFIWLEWDEHNFASVTRNEEWHGGRARAAGVTVSQPVDTEQVEGSLRVHDLDAAFVGRNQADYLRAAVPELVEDHVGNALFFGMRFFTAPFARPYDDQRVRSALTYAIDRRELIDILFQGSGEPSGWVSWPVSQWALPTSELSTLPGYRLGSGGRDQDLRDARALLDAYAADNEMPEVLPMFVEQTSENTLNLGSFIRNQLQDSLGVQVEAKSLPIDELVERLFDQQLPWVVGPDSGWLDLDDWLYPYFHSEGAQNSFALRDEDLDGLIEGQRAEFNAEARRDLGLQVQRRLLEINAGVNLFSERIVALRRSYVNNFPLDVMDGYQDRFADCWIDTEDEGYRRS